MSKMYYIFSQLITAKLGKSHLVAYINICFGNYKDLNDKGNSKMKNKTFHNRHLLSVNLYHTNKKTRGGHRLIF